jgi:hypothetical protein
VNVPVAAYVNANRLKASLSPQSAEIKENQNGVADD